MASTNSEQAQALRAKAAQCRRLAARAADRVTADLLRAAARQCDARATELEPLQRVAARHDEA
jgi:hypothetical protein